MTIFSDWATGESATELRGRMEHFGSLTLPPDSDLDAEWFTWALDELIAERNCYLIIEKRIEDGYGYVQFATGSDGELIAETQSNEFRPQAHLLVEQEELKLLDLGWNPPSCGWPRSDSSNTFESPNFFRSFDAPVPTGEVALLALRTLRDLYKTIKVRDLDFTFFRKRDWRWDDPERRRDYPRPASEGGSVHMRDLSEERAAIEILGYDDADDMQRRGSDEAGRRFATWLGIEPTTKEALWILGRLVGAFADRADVPASQEDPDFREESWSAAGFAAPLDEEIARAGLKGIGVRFTDDLRAAMMRTCHRLMMTLFYETMKRRGDIQDWDKERLVLDVLNQEEDGTQR